MADETGCDAGNWDGGSVAECEHCRLYASAEALRQHAAAVNAIRAAREVTQ